MCRVVTLEVLKRELSAVSQVTENVSTPRRGKYAYN